MDSHLREGDRVGDYVVERHLAEGGNGEVYVAHREPHGERVALKIMRSFSPAAAVRFDREARILQRLEHPNIVRLMAKGRVGAMPYIVMELLEGETLQSRLARTSIEPVLAVQIAAQICDAVAYAHAAAVIHRDLKPGNVFLCAGDPLSVKVLDFGIARAAGERKLTVTGNPLGTWAYMSPEQASGRADVDPRADIWSLASMLYEALAGQLPFLSETPPGMLYQILADEPTPLEMLAPALPAKLTALVMQALRKDRDQRPESMATFGATLREVLAESSLGSAVAPFHRAADPSRVLSHSSPPGERRLAVVVLLDDVRDAPLAAQFASEFGGESISLAGGATVVAFGLDRWNGDEPERAMRFALLARPTARAIGVSTGKVVRDGDAVGGTAVDAAAALLAGRDGAWIDARMTPIARARFEIETAPDGSAALRGLLTPQNVSILPFAAPFRGRDLEMAFLTRAVSDAVAGQRVTATILVGAPGIGKSRLHVEAIAQLRRTNGNVPTVIARGDSSRRHNPLHPLRDALEEIVGHDVMALFDAAELRDRDPVARVDRVHAAFESALVGLAAHGPAVLVLDDAQWLDAATREAVHWLVDAAPDAPIAIWAFTRPDGRDAAMSMLPGAQVLEIGPLTHDATLQILRGIAPDAPDNIATRAAGHPLFLQELARVHIEGASTADSDLPLSIEGALLAQIDQLGAPEREFIKRASIFGAAFWLEGVIALGGEADAVASLRRADLVVSRRKSRISGVREFAFQGAFAQEVAYGLWLDAARPELHRQAAQWLSARGETAPDETARHWELGGDADRAADAYASAAAASAMFADVATTRAHVARALALTTDAAIRFRALVAQDDALLLTTDRDSQRAGLDAMREVSASLSDRERAETAWRRCYFNRACGEFESARIEGATLARFAEALADDRLGCAAEIELAYLYCAEGRWRDAHQRAERATQRAERLGDAWWRSRGIATEAFVVHESGDTLAALVLFERAGEAFARAGDRRREALVKMNAATVMLEYGRIEEAAARLLESAQRSREIGNARTAAVAEHNLGVARRIAGALDEAQSLQDRSVNAARALRHDRLSCTALTERAYLALARGASHESLRAAADELLAIAARLEAPPLVASALAAALRVTHAAGDDTRARIAACREVLDASLSKLLEAELRFALAIATDDPRERELAFAALDAWLASCPPDDAPAARDAMLRRWEIATESSA